MQSDGKITRCEHDLVFYISPTKIFRKFIIIDASTGRFLKKHVEPWSLNETYTQVSETVA